MIKCMEETHHISERYIDGLVRTTKMRDGESSRGDDRVPAVLFFPHHRGVWVMGVEIGVGMGWSGLKVCVGLTHTRTGKRDWVRVRVGVRVMVVCRSHTHTRWGDNDIHPLV